MQETMTHYMQLLATNQPQNLLIFMAIPVVFAETVAITELFLLFKRDHYPRLRKVNKVAGIVLGFYFLGVFVYLMANAAIPLTTSGGWRGISDVLAVGFYLFGVVPLFGIALVEIGVIGRRWAKQRKLGLHVAFVATFLATAHIAMIFGMLNPHLLMPGAATEMAMEEGSASFGPLAVIVVVGLVAAGAAGVGLAVAKRRKGAADSTAAS